MERLNILAVHQDFIREVGGLAIPFKINDGHLESRINVLFFVVCRFHPHSEYGLVFSGNIDAVDLRQGVTFNGKALFNSRQRRFVAFERAQI